MEINKATVHRLIKTMEKEGFVAQDPITRLYSLGHMFLTFASNQELAHQHLIDCSISEMQRLLKHNGECISLQIRQGLHRLCIEVLQSTHTIRTFIPKGDLAELYVGAAGKVLLAALSDEELESILNLIDFKQFTPITITDKNILYKEVIETRRQGYSMSYGERFKGGFTIAVPINNYTCPVALFAVGPEDRIQPLSGEILSEMQKSAACIAQRLSQIKNYLKPVIDIQGE